MRFYSVLVLILTLVFSGCGDSVDKDAPPLDSSSTEAVPGSSGFSAEQAAPFVQLALDCAVQEYPNKIGHTMQSDADQGTPRSLHPAFYGCFDWHSSVHGHWLLARFARLYPEHELADEARRVLDHHLTQKNIAAEVDYLLGEDRASWERPYGLAWLLQLAAELKEWEAEEESDAGPWSAALRPLEVACVSRLSDWLPKLGLPPSARGNTARPAFAFGLVWDYARVVGDKELAALVQSTSRRLYLADRNSDLRFEPSGTGLSFAHPGRGRPDAPYSSSCRIWPLVGKFSAPDSNQLEK